MWTGPNLGNEIPGLQTEMILKIFHDDVRRGNVPIKIDIGCKQCF